VVGLGFEIGRELRAEVSLSDELPKHMISVSELTQINIPVLV
jgi:hypothetical protein